jgi:hypothetical protein
MKYFSFLEREIKIIRVSCFTGMDPFVSIRDDDDFEIFLFVLVPKWEVGTLVGRGAKRRSRTPSNQDKVRFVSASIHFR